MSSAKPESESSQSGVNAAMVHGIEQMIGKVKIFKNRNFEMVKPLEKIKIDYPDIGESSAYIFGHPEAITLPHNYPDITESYNLMHGSERGFIGILKIIRFLINLKIISKNFAAKILTQLESLNTSDIKGDKQVHLPSIYSYAEGVKEKKITHMDAVLWYCQKEGLELEGINSLISKALKEKIEADARELNFLPRQAKLPI